MADTRALTASEVLAAQQEAAIAWRKQMATGYFGRIAQRSVDPPVMILRDGQIVISPIQPGGVHWLRHDGPGVGTPPVWGTITAVKVYDTAIEPEPPEPFGLDDDLLLIAGQHYRVRPQADMTARESFWLLRFMEEYGGFGERGQEYDQDSVLAWLAERNLLRHLEVEKE